MRASAVCVRVECACECSVRVSEVCMPLHAGADSSTGL